MPSTSRTSKLLTAIVDLLKEKREATGTSKKKLAESTGLSRTAIILMERHERQPSLELVLRIAEGLGQSLGPVIAEAEKRIGKS